MIGLAAAALLLVRNPEPAPTDEAAGLVRSALISARAGRNEESSRAFLAAARLAPSVRDWLVLRAARNTPDAAKRLNWYAELRLLPARDQVAMLEASALERFRDFDGAARAYDSLGRPVDAIRLRLLTPAADRASLRLALDRLIQSAAPATVGSAASLMIASFGPLTPGQSLAVARVASPARAVALFGVGLTSTAATGLDSLAFGRALLRVGRRPDAIGVLDRIAIGSAARPAAQFERARADLRAGNRPAADERLQDIVTRYPAAPAAADALLLLGDLAWDDDQVAVARGRYLRIAQHYPGSDPEPRGRFLAALAAWRLGQITTAAAEWRGLTLELGSGEVAAAAEYWYGRALLDQGQGPSASAAWRSLRARDSSSYYSIIATERLGLAHWMASPGPDRFAPFPEVESAAGRIAVLERLGLQEEVGWERRWLIESAGESVERSLTTARAFLDRGQPMVAIRLARAAVAAGGPQDGRTYRLLYPFPEAEHVRAIAAESAVEPSLVAALTRQESAWEVRATSRAGARGLMQIMPATGAQMARRMKLAGWHPDSLYSPGVNLRIGVRYLAETLNRCGGDQVCALAGYNAGPSRVARWMEKPGADDRDFLVERMAFAETRDYVRTVRRNLALYRSLYGAP